MTIRSHCGASSIRAAAAAQISRVAMVMSKLAPVSASDASMPMCASPICNHGTMSDWGSSGCARMSGSIGLTFSIAARMPSQ